MKSLSAVVLLSLLAVPFTAQAEEPSNRQVPYAEIFLGYSYLNADIYGLSNSRQNVHGWKLALSTPLKPYFSLDYEASGNYVNIGVPSSTFIGVFLGADPVSELPKTVNTAVGNYTVFFGPRISYRSIFAHAMIGGDCLLGRSLGISKSEWSLAGALGGGIQFPVTKLISFRFSLDYELAKHDVFRTLPQYAGSYQYVPSLTQNNFRESAGVVFNLGKK
jgi:hypothetical protein